MNERVSHESLPTPERNIVRRLIAVANEVARLGCVHFLGGPEEGDKFLFGFRSKEGASYRVLRQEPSAERAPLTIFIDTPLPGSKLLALHKRYEFTPDGDVHGFVHEDSIQDVVDANKAMEQFAEGNDNDGHRAARVARLRIQQRANQDEAAQRDGGLTQVKNETELAPLLDIFEKELEVIKGRIAKNKEGHA